MFTNLLIGGLLIASTVIFHAFALDFLIKRLKKVEILLLRTTQTFWKAIVLTVVILYVTLALIVEIWVWAGFYICVDAITDLEESLYFSISAFTTVGFGDVVLDKKWRILSAIEATNGFLLFGWSTAFIFEIVSKIYRQEGSKL